MTVGNFLEIIGTAGFDSLTGSDLEIIYGLDDLDSLVAGSGINSNINSTTILVGGSGDNFYSIRDNATAIIFENSGSDNNTLFTTILASGINFNDSSFIIAEIDNRHLYFGNTISNQYALLIDWQEPQNRIENFDLVGSTINYDDFVLNFRDSEGYLGNFPWEEVTEPEFIDLERLNLEPAFIEDVIDTVIQRSEELEARQSSSSIGNFSELLSLLAQKKEIEF